MFSRASRLASFAIVLAAFAATGCRHAAKVAAAPAIAPSMTVAPTPPETKVMTSRAQDFVAPKAAVDDVPTDAVEATLQAEAKGWIRDAFFDFDSTTIRPDAGSNLGSTAQWLRNHQRFDVKVEGHCDERGTEQYNLALGDKRAWSAKEYLATLGIGSQRIGTISFGEDKPFDLGHDEAAWAKNRRAHIVLTSKQ